MDACSANRAMPFVSTLWLTHQRNFKVSRYAFYERKEVNQTTSKISSFLGRLHACVLWLNVIFSKIIPFDETEPSRPNARFKHIKVCNFKNWSPYSKIIIFFLSLYYWTSSSPLLKVVARVWFSSSYFHRISKAFQSFFFTKHNPEKSHNKYCLPSPCSCNKTIQF